MSASSPTSWIDVRIPYEPGAKLAFAYNRAMQTSTSEWVALLDHDLFICNPHWYDMMMEGFKLTALDPGDLPLEKGETLFVSGKPSNLVVVRVDPRFSTSIESLPTPETDSSDDVPSPLVPLGPVDLFLTNQRLILAHNGRTIGVSLNSFRGVEVLLDRFVIIRHQKRLLSG